MIEHIVSMLREESPESARPQAAQPAEAFLAESSAHGVQPLLHWHLRSTPCWRTLPSDIRSALAGSFRHQVAVEIERKDLLATTLQALHEENVRCLLMKGAALAYTHYPVPYLRPRCDTDLLVHVDDHTRARAVLESLGYVRGNSVSGKLVSYQETYSKYGRSGMHDVLDVHWKITNSQRFADLLSFEELAERAAVVPELGAAARGLGPVDALLLACVHMTAHHPNHQRMIWFYDIHLLIERMAEQDLAEVARLAAVKGVSAICLPAIEQAQAWFGTQLPVGQNSPLMLPHAQHERLLTRMFELFPKRYFRKCVQAAQKSLYPQCSRGEGLSEGLDERLFAGQGGEPISSIEHPSSLPSLRGNAGRRMPLGGWFPRTSDCGRPRALGSVEGDEPRVLQQPPRKLRWQVLMDDLRALPAWSSRLRLLREHVFPSRAYMLLKYGTSRRTTLPMLYLRRFLRGAQKLRDPA